MYDINSMMKRSLGNAVNLTRNVTRFATFVNEPNAYEDDEK